MNALLFLSSLDENQSQLRRVTLKSVAQPAAMDIIFIQVIISERHLQKITGSLDLCALDNLAVRS